MFGLCWLVCLHGPLVILIMRIIGCNYVFLNKCPSHDLYGYFIMYSVNVTWLYIMVGCSILQLIQWLDARLKQYWRHGHVWSFVWMLIMITWRIHHFLHMKKGVCHEIQWNECNDEDTMGHYGYECGILGQLTKIQM